MPPELELPDEYVQVLARLKRRVREAQFIARKRVNAELIGLYWVIGRTIVEQQRSHGWGTGVVERLARDLTSEFPSMTGLSRRNLLYMRAFALAWPDGQIVQQPVAQLPWGHITLLLDRLDDGDARDWYVLAAVERGWSRSMLLNQLMNGTRERTGASPSNFDRSLTPEDSDLARQIAKDPYVFDFLDLAHDAAERDLEEALISRMVQTLGELGAGFAFVGRQVHFEVGGDDFHIDLLFFHVEQLRYVVIELKTGRFEPAFAGQLGFYVALVDDRLRRPAHAATVGILICGSRNEHTVRYALRGADAPMAVSTYTYDSLPAEEKRVLPAADRLAAALDLRTE